MMFKCLGGSGNNSNFFLMSRRNSPANCFSCLQSGLAEGIARASKKHDQSQRLQRRLFFIKGFLSVGISRMARKSFYVEANRFL